MKLNNPITVIPPPIKKRDGSVKTFEPIVLNELDLIIVDNNKNQTVVVFIAPIPKPLILWKNNDYNTIGDYTQSQVENKVTELLGNNPKAVLENLFIRPLTYKN